MTLIQRCPHFRVLRSSTVYRNVLVSGGQNRGVPLYKEVSSFQRGWYIGVPLYTEVSSFHGFEEFHCI